MNNGKLTAKLIADLAKHVSNGLANKDAIRLVGISEPTFYRWLREAADEEQAKPLHLELVDALDKASAAFKAANLGIIRAAATEPTVETQEHVIEHKDGTQTKEVRRTTRPPTWQPAAWLLERRFPGEFGRRMIEHAGKLETDASPTTVNVVFGDEVIEPEPEDGGE